MAESLDYSSPQTRHTELTLERTESEVRLVFPPPPQWMQVTNLALNAIFCLATLAVLCTPFVVSVRFRLPLGEVLRSVGIFWRITIPLIFLFETGALVINFREFRRRSHVPNVLSVSDNQLAWTWHWLWGMRALVFPAHEVTSVTAERVTDIFRRKNIFKLRIRFQSRRPMTRILHTNEPSLADEIADAFRRALNL